MQDDILKVINKIIRTEHGATVYIDSTLKDTDLDSYGNNILFLELDEAYGCFDNDWFASTDFFSLTIKDIVDRIINESKIV